jgi:meso-butanediol dehydrogenase/(S,S)-butanediol dehydrogenase/diacetyl reductase
MKVAAITGAGRGIGRNIAHAFEAAGYTIVAIDRSAPEFNRDLSQNAAAYSLMLEISEKHGRVDVLVNNARSSRRQFLGDETEDDWDHEMNVNLKSAYFLAKYAMPLMPNGGSIINIGSVTANFVSHESAAYQISKGACLQMTRVLAMLGAKHGVRCNAVLPGFIIQDEYAERYMREDNAGYRATVDAIHPCGRPGTSDEVAQIALFLASDAASFITGQSITADGGLTMQELAAFKYKEMRGE